MKLSQIQSEVPAWARKNFSLPLGIRVQELHPQCGVITTRQRCVPPDSWQPLMGMSEEVGELMHAFLKRAQGIRGAKEQHDADIRDAIGDILIYMLDFAGLEGLNVEEILEETWGRVSKRDWTKNKQDGALTGASAQPIEVPDDAWHVLHPGTMTSNETVPTFDPPIPIHPQVIDGSREASRLLGELRQLIFDAERTNFNADSRNWLINAARNW